MARPIEEILQELKDLYGPEADPVVNKIETRENWRCIKERFNELKEDHPYKKCVSMLVKEFHASRSLVKKSIHKKFKNDESIKEEKALSYSAVNR